MKKFAVLFTALAVCLLCVLFLRNSRRPGETSGKSAELPTVPGPGKTLAGPTDLPAPAAQTSLSTTAPANPKPTSDLDPRFDWKRITAFNDWSVRWMAATPEQREALKDEGLRLAQERRPEFKKLIVADPERALEQAAKRVVRQELPSEILDQLEKPVSTRGDLNVYMGRPAPGVEVAGKDLVLRYLETPTGESYKARVFGSAESVMSRKDLYFRGVAIDRELAVAPNAVRQLELGERIPAGADVSAVCPVSGKTSEGDPETSEDTIELGERYIQLCNGSHVRILEEQYALTSNISASGGPGGAQPIRDNFPGTSSEAIGNFRALYIRVVYPDRMNAPNTEASAYEDMKNFARYYRESSFGRLSVSTAFSPLVVMPHSREWYEAKDDEVDGLGLVHSDARSEARRMGFDSGQFNVTIVRVNGGPRLSGISWGGGDSVWVSWDGMDVINHECGHSIGRPHANFWDTGGRSAIGEGANQEYGNSFDVMGGGGGFSAHYNTIAKRSLGWLPVVNTHNPASGGTFRIYAYDQPVLEEGKRYSLRVPKDRTRAYNLEFHDNFGVEHASRVELRNSAVVIWSGFGGGGHLIDTTPGSPGGKDDGGIEVGQTFTDPGAAVHFTVVARNATVPPSLDITVNHGNSSENHAPVVSLGASSLTPALNAPVTFTATTTDSDGDALAYHWDSGDGYPSENTPVFTRSFPTARQLTIHCTVSDMKGGVTRKHIVVTAGGVTRRTVTGQVTVNGQPLQGVLLSSSGRYSYSDTDGFYAIPDFSSGTATVTPLLYGYSFAPNPGSTPIGTGPNVVNFAATPVSQISIVATSDANESGSSGGFMISRTGSTAAALDVRVMSASGTAARGGDYNLEPDYVDDGNYRTFTIPAGAASLNVAVLPLADASGEGPETVILQLAEGTNYIAGTSGIATVILNDDDTTLPSVSLTSTDTEAAEGSDNVASFTVARTGPTTANLSVAVAFSGTATRGVDYPNIPTVVTIPAGQTNATVVLPLIDDALVEGSESVTVSLVGAAGYVINPASTFTDVILLDDDIPVVSVVALDGQAAEEGRDPGIFLVSRTGPTTAPLKVYYGLSGTALHGTDYVSLPAEITIPAGAASVPVFITPYDDSNGEGVETIDLGLTVFNGAYMVGSPAAASITLTDNDDVPVVTVGSMSSSTSEPSDGGTLRFQLRGSRAGTTLVRYTVSGTAIPGVDYAVLSGTVTLPAPVNGASEIDIPVSIINDSLKEDVESIIVTLTPDPAYVIYGEASATISLRDDDQPMVAVSGWRDMPAEGRGNTADPFFYAGFYISRSGPTYSALTSGDLTVSYTMSGAAINGTDYTALSGTVVIPNGASSVDLPVTPIDDALVEGTETVTLTIQPSANYGLGLREETLYLADSETPTPSVGFQVASNGTTEATVSGSEFRNIPVTLSPTSTDTVTVEYVVSSGSTAWADGIDWNIADAANGDALIHKGVLTFPPGSGTQNVRVRIIPDNLIEGTEVAALELRNARFARISTTRNRHTLYITDNSGAHSVPRVTFLLAQSSVDEGAGSAPMLIIGLDRPPTSNARVNYAVTGGTATAGTDFTLASGAILFNAGEVSKTIPLTVLNDTEVEPNETVIITLSNPLGSALGLIPVHTLTIQDNDSTPPAINVAATDPTATEGADTATFTFTRVSGGIANDVSVAYYVNGTATPGLDYAALTGTVTIPAGQSSAAVTVTTLNDATTEANETVQLTILPGAAYVLGSITSAKVTLVDDESQSQPPRAFSQTVFVPRNQPTPINLTASDLNGDTLTYQIAGTPTSGSLSGTAPNLTYTPLNNFTGSDSFGFRVTDGFSTSAVATVSITVYNGTLVASNSTWRYNDTGANLGTGWVTTNYNDTTWPGSGPARLGFNDGATTTLQGQPTITYYFRQRFVVPTNFVYSTLAMRLQRDDGVIVYLNGVEVARDNMPGGPIDSSTRPLNSIGGDDELAWLPFGVNPALLRPGTNVIAAEVHQIDGSSSDLGFALELVGTGYIEPASPAAVSLTASDATATEPSDIATFTVTRANNLAGDLTVSYSLAGDAAPGSDYAMPSGTVVIPAGQASATITVTPLNDLDVESDESVIVTLSAGYGYQLGATVTASATITDDDVGRQPPLALSQSVSVKMNTPTAITLTGSDSESDPLTFQIVDGPGNGSLAGTPPNVTYTPVPNFIGTDAFTFRVNDGGLWSEPATVSITVYDPAVLVTAGSRWRYNDAGIDLGTGWRTNGYPDTAWKEGPARLGFGDTQATLLQGQPVVTYYFRQQFVVPPGYSVTNLNIQLQRDDGVVVYLNGTEAIRDNIAAGPVLYSTRPTNSVADAAETTWYSFARSPSLLRPGTNVIAAELHQFDSGSSDAGFALILRADGFQSPALSPELQVELTSPTTLRVWASAPNGLRFAIDASDDLESWQPLTTNTVSAGVFEYITSITSPPRRFYRARQAQ